MNLKLKEQYEGVDIGISFNGKGGFWHYNLKNIKPHQYQTIYNNGYQHLFEVIEEDMPLYEDEEPKGLIDYTSNKKKPCSTCKKKN